MPGLRPKRILVAYSMASTYVTTTLEYLLALKTFSEYDVSYVNVTHGAWMDFDINEYDVVFHNYCARLCFDGYVSDSYQKRYLLFAVLRSLRFRTTMTEQRPYIAQFVDLGFPRPAYLHPERVLAAGISKIRIAWRNYHPRIDRICAGAARQSASSRRPA